VIEKAVDESRFLILLASAEAATSYWVGREVEYWLEHKSLDNLLIALTEGDLSWDRQAGDFYWSDATPLPRILKNRFTDQPLWVDLRAYRSGTVPRGRQFTELGANFAAAIRGTAKEDLLSLEVHQQRRALSLAWSAVVTLVVLTGLAVWEMMTAKRQRERAETVLTAATGSISELVDVIDEFQFRKGIPIDFQKKIFASVKPLEDRSEVGDSPELEHNIATMLRGKSVTLLTIGEDDDALLAARRATAIMQRLTTQYPKQESWLSQLALSEEKVGEALEKMGRNEEALEVRRKVLKIREKLVELEPTNKYRQVNLAVSYMQIADSLRAIDPPVPQEALDLYRKALELSERLIAVDPANPDFRRRATVNHQRIGIVLNELDRPREALDSFNVCVSRLEELIKSDPGDAQWQRDLAICYQYVSETLAKTDQLVEAREAQRKSIEIRATLTNADPKNQKWQEDARVGYSFYGDILVDLESYSEALDAYQNSLSIAKRIVSESPKDREAQRNLELANDSIADLLKRLDRTSEAADYYRESLKIAEELASAEPKNAQWQFDLASSLFNFAAISGNPRGQLARALEIMQGLARGQERPSNEQQLVTEIENALAIPPN
jgi:tetratricopeptide (TPR) repeat protein